MTPGGGFELSLLLMQVCSSMLATWAGIRIVDDIKAWKAHRVPAKDDR